MTAPSQASHARELTLRLAGPGQGFRCDNCQKVVRLVGDGKIVACPYCGHRQQA